MFQSTCVLSGLPIQESDDVVLFVVNHDKRFAFSYPIFAIPGSFSASVGLENVPDMIRQQFCRFITPICPYLSSGDDALVEFEYAISALCDGGTHMSAQTCLTSVFAKRKYVDLLTAGLEKADPFYCLGLENARNGIVTQYDLRQNETDLQLRKAIWNEMVFAVDRLLSVFQPEDALLGQSYMESAVSIVNMTGMFVTLAKLVRAMEICGRSFWLNPSMGKAWSLKASLSKEIVRDI